MTKNQEDKSTSYHNILGIAFEYTTIWDTQPEFKDGIIQLTTVSGSIDAQAAIQKQNITGIAADKKEKKESLAGLILNVSGAIQAYATKIGSNEIYNNNAITRSQLLRMRDTNISGKADLVASNATDLGALLVPFGITSAVVDTLVAAAKDYKDNFLTKPESAIINRKTITKNNLPALFKQADKIVRKILLKMVAQFNTASTDFVQKFIYATYIGTKGVRHTRLSIVVTQALPSDVDATISTPVANALVVIEETGLSGNTDAQGKVTITKVPETASKVSVTYNGVTKKSTVKFERGKATRLAVVFEGAFVLPPAVPIPEPVNA